MRKRLWIGGMSVLLGLCFLMSPWAQSAEDEGEAVEESEQVYHWNDKLGRGFMNIIGAPLELPYRLHHAANREVSSLVRMAGMAGAAGWVVLRLVAGVVDILTFPLGFPEPDKRPLIEPEYAWQS